MNMYIIPANFFVFYFPEAIGDNLLLLIPIALLEGVIICKLLKKGFAVSLKGSFIANLVSAVACLIISVITRIITSYTFFPMVFIGLLVAYYVSVRIESWYYRKKWKDIDFKIIRKTAYRVNFITYILLFIIALPLIKERNYAAGGNGRLRLCAGNLAQIRLALNLYSQSYDGYYPNYDGDAGFKQLIKGNFLNDPDILLCPGKRGRAAVAKDAYIISKFIKFLNKHVFNKKPGKFISHYNYQGGHNVKSGKDSILVWDKNDNHMNSNRNVLYADGKIKGYNKSSWVSRIEPLLNKNGTK